MVVRVTPCTTERTRVRFYVADQPQPQATNSYVNMPLFSHQNVGQIEGTLVLKILRYCRGMFRQWIRHHCAKVSCHPASATPTTGLQVAADIRSCSLSQGDLRPN
jgi:hypothetical protein